MNKNGQTLVEVIIVIAVVMMIVSGLIVGTVTSLKGANFASAESEATKYAQEGIEYARRDRDSGWNAFLVKQNTDWCVTTNAQGVVSWNQGSTCPINAGTAIFNRIIRYDWNAGLSRMDVGVTVSWQDGGGQHKSEIHTFFTNWR